MEEKSRTEYSVRNTTAALISKILAILIGFATRIVFTHTLSESYVGVNGLFSDILNVLALSELGVGTAITYALYEPIAKNDYEKQKSLMQLYARFYRVVAGIVLVGGLLVIPFMDVLIKNQPEVDHLILIYLLYLTNSVLSYLLIYKRTLVDAHQLSYISEIYFTVFLVIQDVFQMIILLTTHNFILFLVIYIICTLGNNISISRKADQLYPYLKEKNIKPLKKSERQEIIKNIKAMLMHKIGDVVINNTDNLLLSSIVGIVSVGCYSNYFLVIGSIHQVMTQIFRGITASVGNLGVTADKKRIRNVFEISFFIGHWMYGVAAICLFELLNPFVEISFGVQYLFEIPVVLMLCVNFYITGMRQATLVFRDSLGIFWFDRYKSVVCAILNLVISIVMAKRFGTIGVFAGTFFSTILTSFWVEPFMLYKYSLKKSVRTYFAKYAYYTAVTVLAAFTADFLCRRIDGGVWQQLFLRACICAIVPNIIYLIFFCRMREFMRVIDKVRFLLDKRRAVKRNKAGSQSDSRSFTGEEKWILDKMAECLGRESCDEVTDVDFSTVQKMMLRSSTVSFYYPLVERNEGKNLPDELCAFITEKSREIVRQNYRLLFLTHYLVKKLNDSGIRTVVLKGVCTAAEYPVPELRKSGDIDLLLVNPAQIDEAGEVMVCENFVKEKEEHSLHHQVWRAPEGIEIELHTMFTEPFDEDRVNLYHEQLFLHLPEKMEEKEIMGLCIPTFCDAWHAYYLLLHMLQHFLRSGFGVRLLCDWVVFWNREREQVREYQSLIRGSGLVGFSDLITTICYRYMGLKREMAEKIWEQEASEDTCRFFMKEIFEAEEFGTGDTSRMVAMRGTHLRDYVREFHHQMKLNFPEQSAKKILWPLLWLRTFFRFCYNNAKIRKTSGWSVLKKAGERSRRMDEIDLFQ